MNKKIVLNNLEYELIEDKDGGFDEDSVKELYTDYFEPYDYVVGDIAYSKLRLKGFCAKDNKLLKNNNDYSNKDKYIHDTCAYGCKYFVLKKVVK